MKKLKTRERLSLLSGLYIFIPACSKNSALTNLTANTNANPTFYEKSLEHFDSVNSNIDTVISNSNVDKDSYSLNVNWSDNSTTAFVIPTQSGEAIFNVKEVENYNYSSKIDSFFSFDVAIDTAEGINNYSFIIWEVDKYKGQSIVQDFNYLRIVNYTYIHVEQTTDYSNTHLMYSLNWGSNFNSEVAITYNIIGVVWNVENYTNEKKTFYAIHPTKSATASSIEEVLSPDPNTLIIYTDDENIVELEVQESPFKRLLDINNKGKSEIIFYARDNTNKDAVIENRYYVLFGEKVEGLTGIIKLTDIVKNENNTLFSYDFSKDTTIQENEKDIGFIYEDDNADQYFYKTFSIYDKYTYDIALTDYYNDFIA